jgi:hypothetical protein
LHYLAQKIWTISSQFALRLVLSFARANHRDIAGFVAEEK